MSMGVCIFVCVFVFVSVSLWGVGEWGYVYDWVGMSL